MDESSVLGTSFQKTMPGTSGMQPRAKVANSHYPFHLFMVVDFYEPILSSFCRGSVTQDIFQLFISQLCHRLHGDPERRNTRKLLILDNSRTHLVEDLIPLFQAVNMQVFFGYPNMPEINFIEEIFGFWKEPLKSRTSLKPGGVIQVLKQSLKDQNRRNFKAAKIKYLKSLIKFASTN